MVERDGPGRRREDANLTELKHIVEKHLCDYQVLRNDMDEILVLLSEIKGGMSVIRWLGYVMTGGIGIAVWHAAQAFFAGHWK